MPDYFLDEATPNASGAYCYCMHQLFYLTLITTPVKTGITTAILTAMVACILS